MADSPFQHFDPASIQVGTRHRRELGDVESLAASIDRIGLLHPVVVTRQGELVAGERRLRAWQQAKPGQPIPAHVINLASIVEGEHAENVERKDFTLSEAVAIKRKLEPELQAEAERRMKAGNPVQTLHRGKTREKVAHLTGFSHETLRKAEIVVAAAESEPERFGKLVEDMDRHGKAEAVFRRLSNIRQGEKIRAEPPPLPTGPYRVAAIDFPWPYEPDDEDPADRGIRPYATMSLAQMRALAVPEIMHPDSIIWVWATNYYLPEAYAILEAWGFKQKTLLTWFKNKLGHGHWLRCQTEHAIMAVRGNPVVTLTNQTTALRAPVRGHSEKPVEFYDLVESLCPAPRYLELFARRNRPGWDAWGDEVPAVAAAE